MRESKRQGGEVDKDQIIKDVTSHRKDCFVCFSKSDEKSIIKKYYIFVPRGMEGGDILSCKIMK